MILLLALATLCVLVAGHAASEVLWEWERGPSGEHGCGAVERAASTVTGAFVLLLFVSWVLAIGHVLSTATLAAALLAMGAAGAAHLVRRARARGELGSLLGEDFATGPTLFYLLAFAPPLLWIVFMAYRGWVMPPTGHDALAYHLPRAVLFIREHGYAYFDATTLTISAYPANYELLLADVILLAGSDQTTEWVSIASYVHLLLLAGAVAERWWGRGAHVAAVVLLTGLAPVTLLHAGAHKNDLLMSAFILATILWSARWAVRGGAAAFVMAYVSVSGAIGTKLSAPLLVAGTMPLIAWRAREAAKAKAWLPARARRAPIVALVVAATFFLGSAAYLGNFRALRSFFPVNGEFGFDEGYGELANLWRYPFMALTVPFSAQDWGVWVPWTESYWFWPRYNLYFSHLGVSTTCLAALLPLCAWRYRTSGDREADRERAAAAVVALITCALIMPIKLRPLGFFGMFTRYLMFVPPLLAAATAAPILRDLATRGERPRQVAMACVLALSGVFVFEAERCARKDSFAPLDYVAQVMDNPRLERSLLRVSAAEFVDRAAGPNDVIAFDGVVDAWIYPTFGKDLTRKVIPIHLKPGVPYEVPAEVQWVVIDRNWSSIWYHPDFKHMGQAASLLFKGTPRPIDLQLFRQLKDDPRWKLVYRNKPFQQSVFQRVEPGAAPAPTPRDDARPVSEPSPEDRRDAEADAAVDSAAPPTPPPAPAR